MVLAQYRHKPLHLELKTGQNQKLREATVLDYGDAQN